MTMIYDIHHPSVGEFEDVPHAIYTMRHTRHLAVRDRMLLFLESLCRRSINQERLLGARLGGEHRSGSGLPVLVQIMTMAHTQQDTGSANVMQASLLLQDGSSSGGGGAGEAKHQASPSKPAAHGRSSLDAEAAAKAAKAAAEAAENDFKGEKAHFASAKERMRWSRESKRRAAQMAKDVLAPKEWFYQRTDGTRTQQSEDALSLAELRSLYEDGEVGPNTPVWVQGMKGWAPVRDVPQLQWSLLMTGSAAMVRRAANLRAKGVDVDEGGGGGEGGGVPPPSSPARSSYKGTAGTPSRAKSGVEGSTGADLYDGDGGVLQPRQLGAHCLRILRQLARLHPSLDANGTPIRPPPRAKRLLSQKSTLPHIVQLMCTHDPALVEGSSLLLLDLVAHNPAAMNKLYTTGVYFFSLSYTGSNFLAIARLLHATHLKQNFRAEGRAAMSADAPIGKRSVLGDLLPECMLCMLDNYGPERFSEVFLGDFDTPEVIWKHGMRRHLVEQINQHVGAFPMRLEQNTGAVFEFGPIPAVTYADLDDELWCHEYYLHNLCDEQRFPDWPIADPVELLRSCLDAWRNEHEKEGPSLGQGEAMAALKLTPEEAEDPNKVRSAYRKLARRYHPDRNPAGREIFERIQAAYELLTAVRTQFVQGPDPVNVSLVVRTQAILYRRYSGTLEPFKYAGYPLLLFTVQSCLDPLTEENKQLLSHCAQLLYLTCLCSVLNAEEAIRSGATHVLSSLLRVCADQLTSATPKGDILFEIATHTMHCISGLAAFESARDQLSGREMPGETMSTLSLGEKGKKEREAKAKAAAARAAEEKVSFVLSPCSFILFLSIFHLSLFFYLSYTHV